MKMFYRGGIFIIEKGCGLKKVNTENVNYIDGKKGWRRSRVL